MTDNDPALAQPLQADPERLRELADAVMPFGRFKGTRLLDLPEPYVVWFQREGYPKGKLGEQLAAIYEIKVNGLEGLVRKAVGSKR